VAFPPTRSSYASGLCHRREAPGAKITVKNQDDQNHTVTSAIKGALDVTVTGGGKATFTAPTKPGSYMFACNFHANMMGTRVVK
jgi:plastocyanin